MTFARRTHHAPARPSLRTAAARIVSVPGWLVGFCLRTLVEGVCRGWDAAAMAFGEKE